MCTKTKLLVVIAFCLSSNVNAALIERLGGQAYYDDVANLTWLADANYAQTSGYDADGNMTWSEANTWAAGLDVDGVTGWRLADTLQPDLSCSSQSGSVSFAYNCSNSEMGNLYYNVLGNVAYSFTNASLFSNVQFYYWTATEYVLSTTQAFRFEMSGGATFVSAKSTTFSAWALQSGDVSAVPIPSAAWLFGTGLIGLIGVARKKKI